MSIVRFYMDEHIHGAITRALRQRGIDVLTVQDDGRMGEPDSIILDRATSLGRVTFTSDVDFLIEARRRQQCNEEFAGVVFAKHRVVAIGTCIANLELIALASDAEYHRNHVEYLPL